MNTERRAGRDILGMAGTIAGSVGLALVLFANIILFTADKAGSALSFVVVMLFIGCIACAVGIILSIAGLIRAMRRKTRRTLSVVALVTACLGIILSFVLPGFFSATAVQEPVVVAPPAADDVVVESDGEKDCEVTIELSEAGSMTGIHTDSSGIRDTLIIRVEDSDFEELLTAWIGRNGIDSTMAVSIAASPAVNYNYLNAVFSALSTHNLTRFTIKNNRH